jgi:hypothetical protein
MKKTPGSTKASSTKKLFGVKKRNNSKAKIGKMFEEAKKRVSTRRKTKGSCDRKSYTKSKN